MAKAARNLVRAWLAAFALWCAALAAAAQEPVPVQQGLMWNRTGLPAVFPLQVRSAFGMNYFLTLYDAETGAPALAAYFEGGRFFRVLVPPGRFRLRLAAGQVWQGEDALFGAGARTRFIDIPQPLTFAVTGFDRKSGHTLDLRRVMGRDAMLVPIAPLGTCQAVRLVADRAAEGPHGTLLQRVIGPAGAPKRRLRAWHGAWADLRFVVRRRVCPVAGS